MKRKISSALIVIMLLVALNVPSFAAEPISVTVNGQEISFDVNPTIIEGTTLAPVRAIFEALGLELEWNGTTKTVMAKRPGTTIELPIGSKYATVNGSKLELQVPATIIDSRTLVPVRFIAESLGANVDWEPTTRTVLITQDSGDILTVHYIDVGQGDSIFIDYGDYDILIDAGENNQGQVVVDYLNSLDTDDIEILVATHNHSDHIGGLDDILKAFDVETIIDSGEPHTTDTYLDYINAVALEKEENNAEFILDDNLTYTLDDEITFKVIELGDNYDNSNNNSVVTMLDYKDIEFLFTGDLESDIEEANLDKFSDIDILKVGHHGSNSSSSRDFLDVIKPEIAVISAGANNSYGHPHLETLVAIGNYVENIYGTWISGSIVIETDGSTYSVNNNEAVPTQQLAKQEKEAPTTSNTSNIEITSVDLSKEIVTIKNSGPGDVNISGWQLVSVTGNQTFTFPQEYIFKANSTIKIVSGNGVTGNGSDTLLWSKSYIWNNDGDPAILKDNQGNIVSQYQ